MKTNKKHKVTISIDEDVANELIKLKAVGDTYSDIIRRLLKKCRELGN